ncbi:SDR family oxidoreductase [Chitinophaga pinensis]|uniref:NAD-dependent epimerase/dehydratase n=1 Tax=Chitinophaga pinensis (strain ATCC 43595 / DSM 2588 / LMG 13176 / NBRC 15968 / NCIMB 11800 / UQM 2034) TaxID=485918 RepID=A0A979GY95_CHIPD|nr:SDR family oxidoreductase [Chitinophaga pinensis]ACU61775.1 NAD-dependent epimerase/dehydratase [Chitinophaga pinensis DSM 2588]
MRVFITGASGFIGGAISAEFLKAGHQVIGLTHSEEGAALLNAAGVDVHRGNINDPQSLQHGIEKSDGVIHCAYMHGFDRIEAASRQESAAINHLGRFLVGSDRPLLITSVAAMGIAIPGQPAIENHFDPNQRNPRYATETAATHVADQGVHVSVVRLPQVHNTQKFGIVSSLLQIARAKGISAYVGEGANRWAAAHLLDVAALYRLVLEKNEPRTYHAVSEEGITLKEIAATIAERLNIPLVSLSVEEAQSHFGPLAMFLDFDMSASSEQTRQRLHWHPAGPGLIEDLRQYNIVL